MQPSKGISGMQIAPDRTADIDQTRLNTVLDNVVKTAAEWQANGLKRQGSGTGACLRTNFLLMADTVMQQDAHLLLEDEKQLLSAFKVCWSSLEGVQLELLNVYVDAVALFTFYFSPMLTSRIGLDLQSVPVLNSC